MGKIKNQKNKEINIEKENEKKSENNFFIWKQMYLINFQKEIII